MLRTEVASLTEKELSLPGGGDTPTRWLQLHALARCRSVSVARLVEAHVDATAILAEASLAPVAGDLYGVWASAADPSGGVRFDPFSGTVSGSQPFCSGVGIVDAGLLTAWNDRGGWVLVEVGLGVGEDTVAYDVAWASPALAETSTGTVDFTAHPVRRVVGRDDWYLKRPGFWHGAIGPAACWAGAAAGLYDWAARTAPTEPTQRVAVGEMLAEVMASKAILHHAGHCSDQDPDDSAGARTRAYAYRHAIARSSTNLLEVFSRAFGPRPFVSDSTVAQRAADVHLYVRQQHGDRDLLALADLILGSDDG